MVLFFTPVQSSYSRVIKHHLKLCRQHGTFLSGSHVATVAGKAYIISTWGPFDSSRSRRQQLLPASSTAGRVVSLGVGGAADEGGRVKEHAGGTHLDVVVAGDVAVDVLVVVAGVWEEEGTSGQGLRRAGVRHLEGCYCCFVKLVQSVWHARVGAVVPDVIGYAVLQPRPSLGSVCQQTLLPLHRFTKTAGDENSCF